MPDCSISFRKLIPRMLIRAPGTPCPVQSPAARTHFLSVAESVIKISADNIPGKKKNKKILKISPQKPRIRHKGILYHPCITKTGKMIIHSLVRNQDRKSGSGSLVTDILYCFNTDNKYTLILNILYLSNICHF